jgi:phosphohistidine phosphatase SixA
MYRMSPTSIRHSLFTFTLTVGTLFVLAVGNAQYVHASDDLWNSLREGGKVVLIRHAPVDRNNGNPLVRDSSCVKEMILSEQGKKAARELGERFRRNNIVVHKVMHSPFCRTTETAQQAFDTTNPSDLLSLLEILSTEDAQNQTQELIQFISEYSAQGNLVLITHEPNINAISFELIKHLDALVIEPGGDGEFEELGVIHFTEAD